MFREDMISDGIENCVQYIHNFDPKKSSNPFAYFTQIIHYAFLRRIQREKRQLDIKNKIVEKTGFESLMTSDTNLTNEYRNDYNAIRENIINKRNSWISTPHRLIIEGMMHIKKAEQLILVNLTRG